MRSRRQEWVTDTLDWTFSRARKQQKLKTEKNTSGGNIEEKQGFTNIEVNAALQNERVLWIKKRRKKTHIDTIDEA